MPQGFKVAGQEELTLFSNNKATLHDIVSYVLEHHKGVPLTAVKVRACRPKNARSIGHGVSCDEGDVVTIEVAEDN